MMLFVAAGQNIHLRSCFTEVYCDEWETRKPRKSLKSNYTCKIITNNGFYPTFFKRSNIFLGTTDCFSEHCLANIEQFLCHSLFLSWKRLLAFAVGNFIFLFGVPMLHLTKGGLHCINWIFRILYPKEMCNFNPSIYSRLINFQTLKGAQNCHWGTISTMMVCNDGVDTEELHRLLLHPLWF